MIVDYSLEHYQAILSQVLKWRAVPLNLLQEMSDYPGTRASFYRVIRTLENRNLIKATHFNGISKIVFPTDELAKLSPQKFTSFQEESLNHESIVTQLCFELLSHEIFNNVSLPHEVTSGSYDSGMNRLPDAILEGVNNGALFKMALEVEITRKSKIRVQNKVEDYLRNGVFDYILYVFNDKATFEAYQRFIKEIIQKPLYETDKGNHEARFILGFAPRFIGNRCRLNDVEIYYFGKRTKLDSIFGKRRMTNGR